MLTVLTPSCPTVRSSDLTGALTADYPAAVAFDKNGVATYVAYNYGPGARYVSFSDGMGLNVQPDSFRIKHSGDTPDGSSSSSSSSSSSRSEEHTSELQSLMRISYAVFCLKKKKHP